MLRIHQKIVVGIVSLSVLLTGCGNAESTLSYESLPANGDAERGQAVFVQQVGVVPSCIGCHVEGAAGAPSLVGYSEVADSRVEGQDAHEYTFYAIAEPGQHIVEGYGNAMYNRYDENLDPQEIADLIAYLLEE